MDPNVPQQKTSSTIDTSGGGEPLSRARMLIEIAALVAKGLPCPETVAQFAGQNPSLTFPSVTDLMTWVRHLDTPGTDIREQVYVPQYQEDPIRLVNVYTPWRGTVLSMSGSDPVAEVSEALDPSDPAVATVLAAAGEPAVQVEDTPAGVLDEVDDAVSDEPADGGDSDG